jgi:hypothetical protein
MAPIDGGAILFGGLRGDDTAPMRLNDTWRLRVYADDDDDDGGSRRGVDHVLG